jgi:hypothetical protein
VTPLQGAGLIVLSMGDEMLTHLSFRSLDPTERSKTRGLTWGKGSPLGEHQTLDFCFPFHGSRACPEFLIQVTDMVEAEVERRVVRG